LNSYWRDFKRGFNDGYSGVIRKTVNGQLIYVAPNESKKAKDRYYTLFTKNGGEYGLELADGTMIWVNSATTISYPANLSQDTIKVTVDGEAYFDIPDSVKHVYSVYTAFTAKQERSTASHQMSTINDLRSPDDAIEIITGGAQFNVKSYADEPAPSISLISGTASMRLDTATRSSAVSIAAGQQVKLDFGKLEISQIANAGDVIAWKNNQTSFHDAYIESILREVARWYNVKIVYEGVVPDKKYSITIPRDAKIEDLLDMLRKQGGHFMIHRRTITVSH
jgi:ferric-dicitrate binding protein FerR (iron transport regulator)